jgi:S1-C subfamily serine protease
MRKFTDWGPAFVVLAATVAALLLGPSMVRRVEFAQTSARVSLARQALGEDDILERIDQAVRRVAEAVEPSVVHIDVRLPGMGRWHPSSSGSGWLFDADGHVVTNAHVVRGAESIRVQLSDGRLFTGEVVGADPLTDIAVVGLGAAESLIPAVRATGQQPRQGERVFAFGSPFGFKFSMSEGIISGLGREPAGAVAASSGYTNFIQTDAAVNPGNSGGPLVNVRGQVVGMNVAIATGAESEGTVEGQSAGISFAIPLTVIESVVDQLIETGAVRRGFLGINLPRATDTPEAVGFNGFGVLVPAVTSGGPADQAGLRPDDVILSINGHPATGVGVLRSLISIVRPGEVAELRVWRDGDELTIPVTLGEADAEVVVGPSVIEELGRIGLTFWTGRGTLAWDDQPVIEWVAGNSPAAETGFERNQRVLRVGAAEVETLRDMTDQLAAQGLLLGRPVDIVVEAQNLDTKEPEERTLRLRLAR